jgi:hypothetical protein
MKLFLALILSSLATVGMGQGLVYQLAADSSITPAVSGIPSGPSEALSGSFTWVPHFPSYITDSDTFDITRIGADTFPVGRSNGVAIPIDVGVAILDSGIDPHPGLPTPASAWNFNSRRIG